jgi:hypothetical protein
VVVACKGISIVIKWRVLMENSLYGNKKSKQMINSTVFIVNQALQPLQAPL